MENNICDFLQISGLGSKCLDRVVIWWVSPRVLGYRFPSLSYTVLSMLNVKVYSNTSTPVTCFDSVSLSHLHTKQYHRFTAVYMPTLMFFSNYMTHSVY